MAENIHLPDDLLLEIFSWLPTKSVCKFNCVSKSLRTRLAAPEFITLHCTRKPFQENLLLINPNDHSLHTIPIPVNNPSVVSRKVDSRNCCNRVIGSCNGLVLLYNRQLRRLSLVNPVTLEEKTIPTSTIRPKNRTKISSYGFGYDSSSEDYKIVSLYNHHVEMYVDVFSLKQGRWKRLNNFPDCFYNYVHVPRPSPGVFLDGAIHWLVTDYEVPNNTVVIAFDLAHESLRQVFVSGIVSLLMTRRLYVADGCLVMVGMVENVLDIWQVNERKRYAIETDLLNRMPLCFVGEEEVVFRNRQQSLVVYNTMDGTRRDIVVHGVVGKFLGGGKFVDSFVSPVQISGGIGKQGIICQELRNCQQEFVDGLVSPVQHKRIEGGIGDDGLICEELENCERELFVSHLY